MDKDLKDNGGSLVVYKTDTYVRLGIYTIDVQGFSYENELNSMYRFGYGDSKDANEVRLMEYDARMVSFLKQCRKRFNRWSTLILYLK